MKTAISLPDKVFKTADAFARRHKMSRSALFSTAVEEFIQHHTQDDVTKRLNEVYTQETSNLDPVLQDLQASSLAQEQW